MIQEELLQGIAARLDRLIALQERALRLAVPVEEAAVRLDCSRSRVFELLEEGLLEQPAVKTGKGTLVIVASIERLLSTPRKVKKETGAPKTRLPKVAPPFNPEAELAKLKKRKL